MRSELQLWLPIVCMRVNTLPRSPRTSVHSFPFARSRAVPGDHFLCELGLPAEYSPLGRIAVYQCLTQPIEHERAKHTQVAAVAKSQRSVVQM